MLSLGTDEDHDELLRNVVVPHLAPIRNPFSDLSPAPRFSASAFRIDPLISPLWPAGDSHRVTTGWVMINWTAIQETLCHLTHMQSVQSGLNTQLLLLPSDGVSLRNQRDSQEIDE